MEQGAIYLILMENSIICQQTNVTNTLLNQLKSQFPDYSFETTEDEDKGTLSIEALKGKKGGFDVDINLAEQQAAVSYSSSIRTFINVGSLVLTGILTYLFGGAILYALGLVAESGYTLDE